MGAWRGFGCPPTPTPTAAPGGSNVGAQSLKTVLPPIPGTSPVQDSPSTPSQTTKPVPRQCSHPARTHSTARGTPCLGAQPCPPIASMDICHPHLFPLHLPGEHPHPSTPASKSQPHARSMARGGAAAGGCQPWVPRLLMEGNMPHSTPGCCLEGGQHGRAASQGGSSPQPTQSPASWAAGQRPQPGSSGWLLEKSLRAGFLCISHLKAAFDLATSLLHLLGEDSMGYEAFPCIPGRGCCSQARIARGTSCCLRSRDHNPTEPRHLYSHLCPVLGSNPAPHRGE